MIIIIVFLFLFLQAAFFSYSAVALAIMKKEDFNTIMPKPWILIVSGIATIIGIGFSVIFLISIMEGNVESPTYELIKEPIYRKIR